MGCHRWRGRPIKAPPKAIPSEPRTTWPLTLQSGQVFNILGYPSMAERALRSQEKMCISGNWILAKALRTALAMGRAWEALGRARWVGFESPLPPAAGRDGGNTAELSVCPGVSVAHLGQKRFSRFRNVLWGATWGLTVEAASVALTRQSYLRPERVPVQPLPWPPPPFPSPRLLHYNLPSGRNCPA